MKAKRNRILSLSIVFAMLLGLVPSYAWEKIGENTEIQGEEAEGSAASPFIMSSDVSTQLENGMILVEGEIGEKREELVKHFYLSSGLSLAMQYPHPVHYEAEEGLVDIDNTLKATDGGMLRNTSSSVCVELPQELGPDGSILLTKDGYSLRFCIENIQLSSAEIANPAEQKTVEELQKELKLTEQEARAEYNRRAIETRSESTVIYREAYPVSDLRYDLEGLNLKESIVIGSSEAVLPEYTIQMKAEGLICEAEDSGAIRFFSEEGEIFSIPAPVVFDAKGEEGPAEIDFERTGEFEYRLTYRIDPEWIVDQETAYPIVLDPTVYPGYEAQAFTVARIHSSEPNANTCTTSGSVGLHLGYTSREGIRRSYLKINTLPNLSLSEQVVCAALAITGSGEHSTRAFSYMVNEDTEIDYSQITWNRQPSYDSRALSYITADIDDEFLESFDITRAVQSWYMGETNNGIVFRSSDETSHSASLSPTRKLALFYISTNGLEDHWDYTTISMGRAGTAYVQNLSGNLTLVRNDLAYGGEILPAEATFVYNLSDKDTNIGYGKGFRSIYNQTIRRITVEAGLDDDTYYIWRDADGTERYFKYVVDPDTDDYTITSENRDGYTMSIGSASGNRYSVKDKKGNYLRFDRYGRLFKIQEKIGISGVRAIYNEIQIEYTADIENQYRIRRVIDGVGRVYAYEYTDPLSGDLASVSFLDTNEEPLESVSFTYNSGRPTYVTYADGKQIRYTWYSSRITGIYGVSDSGSRQDRLSIGYPNVTTSGGNQKVSSLAYFSGQTELSRLDFEYGPGYCTLTDGVMTSSREGRKTTYHFNPYGNTISVSNSAGQWSSGTYEKDLDPEASANRLSAASRLQQTLTGLEHLEIHTDSAGTLDLTASLNQVLNGDFEESTGSEWVRRSLASSDKIVVKEGNRGTCGNHAFKISNGFSSASKELRQTLALSGDQSNPVTFGGWFLYTGPSTKGSRRVCLKAELYRGSTKKATEYAYLSADDPGWQFVSGQITASSFNKIVITILNHIPDSSLYADGIQLTEESCQFRYTYNGDGDITSVKTADGKTTTYGYTNGNLTYINPPGNGEFRYTYSSNHLTRAKTPLGLQTDYTYDANGNRLTETIKPTSSLPALKSETVYSGDGTMVESITAADRNTVTYDNDYEHLRTAAVIDPKGIRTEYTYDVIGRVVSTQTQGVSIENTYEADRLTELRRTDGENAMTYGFVYGLGGLPISVTAADRTLVENEYNEDTLTLSRSTYGNGDAAVFAYDELTDELTEKTLESENGQQRRYEYYYNAKGALCRTVESGVSSDHTGWTPVHSQNYLYNTDGQLERTLQTELNGRAAETVVYDSTLSYSANGAVTELTETVYTNNVPETTEYSYSYDLDDRPVTSSYGSVSEALTYDSYSRLSEKTISSGVAERIHQTYTYRNAGAEYTTPQVSSLATTFGSNNLTHSYTYDANGNILSDSTAQGTIWYEYDSFNQLICEENGILGKAWEYTYDLGGNILSKTERSYTTGTVGAVISTHSYRYDDESWNDLLTEYDGESITYDQIGNPLSYRGWTMDWKNGRQLASMSNGSSALSFDYNESGLRTSKIVNGFETRYIWNGNRLVAELGETCSFYFHYNSAGEMIGYTYGPANGSDVECLLVKNLQGDVERVISAAGAVLASYTYDAWGNICQISGNLANVNPIRYRGYYYDSETGLYYLQSRYYDPLVGRFVNADGQIDSNAGLVGTNLFSYTANNPVHSIDDSGSSLIVVAGAVLGGCAGGYAGYKIAESNGYTGWKKAGTIAGCAVIGGAVGSCAGLLVESISTQLSKKIIVGQILTANRQESGLKDDIYHRAATFLSKEQLMTGESFAISGNDGCSYTLFQVKGELNGHSGVFEYILDRQGNITHQLFKNGGTITGVPNAK